VQQKTDNISIDESVLIQRCRAGDSAAMERLILRYQNRIYNVILKICANPDDAAELTQDAFVRLIENIDKFAGRSSFYTWAFRIAVNLTLTHCKRNVKLGFRSLDAAEDVSAGDGRQSLKEYMVAKNAPDPAIVVQKKELCQLVVKSLMRLDDEQRTALVLRDIEGMSYGDIAEVLEVELGTVKSRISRARGNLREILEVIYNE